MTAPNAPMSAEEVLKSIELQEYRLRAATLTRELRGYAEKELRACRTAVAAMAEREAALVAERDALNACLLMIYKELQHVAPWPESNDMTTADEIMCGIGLMAQARDALRAEVEALRELASASQVLIEEWDRNDTNKFDMMPAKDWEKAEARFRSAIDAARAEARDG